MEQVLLMPPYSPIAVIGLFFASLFILLTFISRRRTMDMRTLRESKRKQDALGDR